ncbi:ketosteroid isomerase-like protein [Agromyces terreus]|uniref:Ketosteroid isomerase-like protein n=1 Tax=Agromyces terreus TaxID=424795 RepID=A0A9X2KBC0_9MICO|nr:cache domain-containing protein [Agromyces terreus]MCP2370434.1 ketosteroid isomerase-like protein [Agromyces terreus]
MSTTLDLAAEHIARQVASTIEPALAMVEGWRGVLETELSGPFAGALGGSPDARAETLDPVIEALVGAELEREGALITGAGFVAAPGFLADAQWHLAWWLSSANTFGAAGAASLRRLDAVSDPDSEQFRDYTTLEWWRVPERTGRRHLTGPYVDYLCTDDYTVTITTPVFADGEMIGVVGADAYVARLEGELLPVLREWSGSGTLVNASGRILASNDSRRATGALLRIEGLAGALAPLHDERSTDPVQLPGGEFVVPCGDTTLALVAESPRPAGG